MTAYHRVPSDLFRALASGLGGRKAVAEFAAAQSSKRRLLLRHLFHTRPTDDTRAAGEVLIKADRHDRQVVADLMSDPLVGSWIMSTVRRLTDDTAGDRDIAQLGALAAAAAVRTRQDTALNVQALDGGVALPTVGTASTGHGSVEIKVSAGSATFVGSGDPVLTAADDRRWFPLRELTTEHGGVALRVTVEDRNPYRDRYHAAPATALDADELRRWQELTREAWSLIVRYRPERAAELSAGLRSLIPLALTDGDMARSGTARDTFGAIGLTRPRSASDFAVTLVHEFQHSKLSGLLDLVPLTVPGGSERHFAPWRVDPRPTAGLLQGVYAFLGVADTWRTLRAAPDLAEQALREFAVVRRQVDEGLAALERSTEVTDRGREFVTHLRFAVDRLLAEPLPASVAKDADDALVECRRAWDARNRVSAHEVGRFPECTTEHTPRTPTRGYPTSPSCLSTSSSP